VAAFRYLQAYAQVSKGPVRVLAKLKEVYPQSTRRARKRTGLYRPVALCQTYPLPYT
jgi:hypothetical protein